MANKNVALPSKLKVIGASLDRALQEDGVILTTERINIRAEDWDVRDADRGQR